MRSWLKNTNMAALKLAPVRAMTDRIFTFFDLTKPLKPKLPNMDGQKWPKIPHPLKSNA